MSVFSQYRVSSSREREALPRILFCKGLYAPVMKGYPISQGCFSSLISPVKSSPSRKSVFSRSYHATIPEMLQCFLKLVIFSQGRCTWHLTTRLTAQDDSYKCCWIDSALKLQLRLEPLELWVGQRGRFQGPCSSPDHSFVSGLRLCLRVLAVLGNV